MCIDFILYKIMSIDLILYSFNCVLSSIIFIQTYIDSSIIYRFSWNIVLYCLIFLKTSCRLV